jgi:hypothetical protein
MATLPTLLTLPSSVLCTILSEFLTIDSFCVFESAVSEAVSRQLLENLMTSAEFGFEDNRSGDGHDVITWLEKRGDAEIDYSVKDDLWEYLDWLHENKKRRNGNGFLLWLRKRRISVKYVNLLGCINVTDEGLVGLSSIFSAL